MKTAYKTILILSLLLIFSPITSGALTFNLDTTNNNNTGTAGPWTSVTLTDSIFNGKDSIHFVIDPIESAFLNPGTNFRLQSFYFNENTSFGSNLMVGNFSPTGWSYSYNSGGAYNAGGGFGKFEFLTSGTGSTGANPLSFDIYNIAGSDVTIANFSTILSDEGYLFAAHIADYNGGNSAKFATDGSIPVPEPGTLVLLSAGMFGIAVWYRRRENR